ncbi:bifunctional adenosylcobinamide kinase/adenosylcobinamide-phosphate guanylyltransferase [Actinoplanes sp. NPDC049265]|uniref:bifunctional adenosylcobinamide kinase/adenosylcobinamide-phosphate guanylyltransferase n=1 Tax=Actinoplanes sp. NPDC049265 TaxID=3363902 RepID=UPI00371B04AA
MSVDRWNTALVLGGIRSGKSAFAEELVADAASVRYVATAVGAEDDPEWMGRIEAHQRRRPQTWSTEETGPDPARLAAVLAEAKPDETLLIDDLGGWVAALLDPANQPQDDVAMVAALAEAVRECAGRVVLVSPEVGLSLVPATVVGRAFADALGTTNQALAAVVDRVALVVAGQHTWIKAAAGRPRPAQQLVAPSVEPTPVQPATIQSDFSDISDIVFESGMDLPMPDQDAGPDAHDRLGTLDLTGAGLGALGEAVEFAAATQGTVTPQPWSAVRVLLLSGTHAGGSGAGTDPADVDRRVAEAEAGTGPLIRLAGQAGADVAVVRAAGSGAMEDGPVLDAGEVEAALRHGWQLAAAARADGKDALVIAACGTGAEAAATAVLAATTGAEPVAVLPRVLAAGGTIDDNAWMVRCAAVRDGLHRIRTKSRGALDILAQVGGADVAVATGALLGAAAHRLPVLLDGPVGIAAGLVARDLGSQARHWCLLADAGTSELVQQGADVLGLTPVTELGLDLGEGLNALTALPVLRTVIGLAGALPTHPALAENTD